MAPEPTGSWPARWPLAAVCITGWPGELEQKTNLLREYNTDAQNLCPQLPEVPAAHDYAPTTVALGLLTFESVKIGDILIS